jgi:hypothetical protein
MMTFNPTSLAIVKNKNITHPSATGFYDLTCVSTSVCVAGDTVGYMFEFNPTTGSLTTPKKLFDAGGAQFNGIACASSTQCTAVNQVGIEFTFDPAVLPLKAHHATLTSNADPLQGVACPAANQCIAGDQNGNARTFDPTSATPKTTLQTKHLDPGNELFGMSCTATTFCATVDGDGNAYEGAPGTGTFHHDTLPNTPSGVNSIGCSSNASATECGAVDGSGDVYVGKGAGIKPPPITSIPLTLVNGWKNSSTGTAVAAVESVAGGLVQLKGAISTAGADPVAFTLPAGYRPATNVYVTVDTANGSDGRLSIAPSGVVTVQGENGSFSNAAGFTSLDGVSFALNESSFTPVTLQNGWTSQPFGTANVAVENVGGVVHLAGAMMTSGANAAAFTLPAADRPTTNVFVPVDMYGASNGRLNIAPSGVVTVQAENGSFNNAAAFTSLEGASFVVSPSSLTTLTLVNGWTGGPFGTSQPAVADVAGVVRLKGAIANTTSPTVPFTLPAADRPTTNVYIPVDMCDATNGRLDIAPSGVVTVEPEGGAFSNDQCFTSLDGAEFALK